MIPSSTQLRGGEQRCLSSQVLRLLAHKESCSQTVMSFAVLVLGMSSALYLPTTPIPPFCPSTSPRHYLTEILPFPRINLAFQHSAPHSVITL